MLDDVILNKVAIIGRCIKRVQAEYKGFEQQFTTNLTKQDSIILNIQRACEASIDLAAHIIRLQHLGLPQSGRDVFIILEQANIIETALSGKLQAIVEFRNIAVRNYTQLNLATV